MKLLNKTLVLITCFITLCSYSQKENIAIDPVPSPFTSILEKLPKISKDSTEAEITTHVEAMLEWMTEEHYKSSFAPILIYAEKGLALSKRSGNNNHIHDTRTIIGNTLIRINDSIGAKKLFLKSLEEAKRVNDSSIILRTKGNLANIYYFVEGYKSRAIKLYLESVEIAEQLKDTTRLFVIHHNLSRVFNETEKPERSAYHIEKTEFYLNLIGSPPHFKASHLHNIGRRLLLLNKPDEAIENFKQTIALTKPSEYEEALIEGYVGYKDALLMKEDYKGAYEIDKKLKAYEEKKDKDEAKNIIESVSAKLNAERYKDQIKSKELEKELLENQAQRNTLLLFVILAVLICICIIFALTYLSNIRRKQLIRDLKDKNVKYLEAKRQSDELTKAKAKFFATVSHELRTPLYGVVGLSSILLENNDLKKHEKDLKSLKFSANYLLALVNDLLHINKIENNSFPDEESTFDIKELSDTIVSSFEYVKLQHENEVSIRIAKDVPILLHGNSTRLSQILMNLIGNACKFTEKGEIILEIKKLEQSSKSIKIQFRISDTGPGIEKNKLDQIFDEFTQIDSMSSKYQGTGLGLPIVKKLVEQAGGIIEVESELGKGTVFDFVLDFAISKELESENPTPILNFKELAKKKILIVEDNRINQSVTKRILENEGVLCEVAQNGEEAIHFVKEKKFDLVLMDINMPVKNGIEATTEIRAFNRVIPIIALTAVEVEQQKYQIFNCGMNDIILKPYDMDKFKKTIVANLSVNEIGVKKAFS
ncbi:response regulator [Ascidiimonas sp. W6]|uniref:tetratricopeptide repeat-containing hybrid sensor histidine kinase/response regulator n=1 Tax=Ascidiimonas meishanensis TaxID=3128903 RepID=UPI0030EF4223